MSKQQRRKGNVQTASSSRAAELVAQSGHAVPFISFAGYNPLASDVCTSFETTQDDIDPEIRNSLKKMSKKDALTREKGLKELFSQLERTETERVNSSFPHFVSMFPKLIMDGTPSIRSSSIQVLSSYIRLLRKSSEKYLKDALPYAFFAAHDTYAQVTQSTTNLFLSCFPGEKHAKVFRLFLTQSQELALQILNRSHPLLDKGEGEETDNQRISRLTFQALNFLRSLTEKLLTDDSRKLVLDFVHDKKLVKNATAESLQVAGAFFALLSRLLALKWEGVATKELLLTSLSNLDSPNRILCQSSASFFLLSSSGDVFMELSIQKAVIPKIISVVRKKDIHWENLGAERLLGVLKMVVLKVPLCDRSGLLFRILDSFYEGMPWQSSFSIDTWSRCLQGFVEFACDRSTIGEYSPASSASDDFEEILKKIAYGMELSFEEKDNILVRKLASIFLSLISRESLSTDKFLMLIRNFLLNLLSKLPRTEDAIIDVLRAQSKSFCVQLSLMVLRHTECTSGLLANIIETFDENILLELDGQFSLLKAIVSKMDWRDEKMSLRLLASLLKMSSFLAASPDQKTFDFQDYYKLDTELSCMRLVKAALLSSDCPPPNKGLDMTDWEKMVKTALYATYRDSDPIFLQVLDYGMELFTTDAVVSEFLEGNQFTSPKLLLEIAVRTAKKGNAKICTKVSDLMLQFLVSTAATEDIIQQFVDQLLKMNVGSTYIIDFIRSQLEENMSLTDPQVLLSIAYKLSPESVAALLIEPECLMKLLLPLDVLFGAEILINDEFLAGDWSQCFSVPSEELPSAEEIFCRALKLAYFFMDFFIHRGIEHDDIGNDAPSMFYIVAVSNLPVTKFLSGPSFNFRLYGSLKEKTNNFILHNEKLRLSLLDYSQRFGAQGLSLCYLRALRALCVGMHLWQFLQNLATICDAERSSVQAAAARAVLNLKWEFSSPADWICRIEMASASQDPSLALEALKDFVCLGRSYFDEFLFVFQQGSDQQVCNALSCALLRLLSFSCNFVDQMDSDVRDFLCCALITSLESCRDVPVSDSVGLFEVFSSLAVRLFKSCTTASCKAKDEKDGKLFEKFEEEWTSFFSSTAQELLFFWFMSLADHPSTSLFANYVSSAIHFCSLNTLKETELTPRCDIELDALNYPVELQSLAVPLVSLISSSSSDIQFAALRVLKLIVAEMLLHENKADVCDEEAEEVTKAYTRKLPVLCDRLLNTKGVGAIAPSLLVWDALVSSLAEFEAVERVPYCHMLLPLLNDILPSLFDRLPPNPDIEEMCLDSSLFVKDMESLEMISQYYFGLFYRTLATLPALVRQWYAALPRSVSAIINPYTAKYVSPLVWKAERDKILSQEFPVGLKVRVRGRGSVREIVAEFELDDSKMELDIELPMNYPLSVPIIENEKAIVGRETRRKWVLQLTLFISHQNGAIADAIALWARNIEKHMEGAEDCAICMCTVHSSTYQLPRVKCKQCKKKFHVDCIRKWFESSSQSTCPLCRTVFRS